MSSSFSPGMLETLKHEILDKTKSKKYILLCTLHQGESTRVEQWVTEEKFLHRRNGA